MSNITEDVSELKSVTAELKRLRKSVKELTDLKKQCEARILEYLENTEQPGIKAQGITVVAAKKQKRAYQKQQTRLAKGAEMLQQLGVPDAQAVLAQLLESMRGPSEEQSSLKIL